MTAAERLAVKSRQLVNKLRTKREVGNVHSLDIEQTRLEQEILHLAAVVDGTKLPVQPDPALMGQGVRS